MSDELFPIEKEIYEALNKQIVAPCYSPEKCKEEPFSLPYKAWTL